MSNKRSALLILLKLFILLLVICPTCFARGGHSGGRGGGRGISILRSGFSRSRGIGYSSPRSNLSNGEYFTIIIVVILCHVIDELVDDRKLKKANKRKILKNYEAYCNNFLLKFNDLHSIPNEYDISEIYYNIGRKILLDNILIQLIINKLKIINNLSLSEQYDLFYTQDVNIIDIFQLPSNTVSKSKINQAIQANNEINNLLENNKYIKIKFNNLNISSSNLNSTYLISNSIITINRNNILRMYFNQQLIFKEILLKVFLDETLQNDVIKYDILYEVNKNINIKTLQVNNKEKMLFNAIIQNSLENKTFKEKFLGKANILAVLRLMNYTKLILNNRNNKSKLKKYNNLLEHF